MKIKTFIDRPLLSIVISVMKIKPHKLLILN